MKLAYFKGVYKSTNDGNAWSLLNGGDPEYPGFGWWFGQIRVHPNDPDEVYTLGLDWAKTTDGGQFWTGVSPYLHADYHAFYIHPAKPDLHVVQAMTEASTFPPMQVLTGSIVPSPSPSFTPRKLIIRTTLISTVARRTTARGAPLQEDSTIGIILAVEMDLLPLSIRRTTISTMLNPNMAAFMEAMAQARPRAIVTTGTRPTFLTQTTPM
jgi:hypothetical protein